MYRIRFHGRGGQGLKTASRVLGTAFFREGFEVQDAPRYGAERRGAPIFAYVRADRTEIHERGVIRRPDLVAVADETVVPVPVAGVLAGLHESSVLLIASHLPEEHWRERLAVPGRIILLPTEEGGGEDLGQTTALRCAAAAARLVGEISRDALAQAVADETAAFGAEAVAAGQKAAAEAFEMMAAHEGIVEPSAAPSAADYARPNWIALKAEDTGRAAPVIHGEATSVQVRTGLWRMFRPVIDLDHCVRCGLCNAYCPDGTIPLDAEGWPHVDYQHCKGCMICVAQCPVHAISAIPETQAVDADTKNQDAAKGARP